MARVRSPSYPSYPLDEAIANAQKIFEKDRRAPVDRAVVAKHLGYSSLNGAADKSIATMMQYGMLEKVAKGEVRVSQWAVDILFPDSPDQRISALNSAAASPALFRALNERFTDGPPSNETLRSYLLREDYNDRALGPIISAYTKTSAYLAQEGATESGGSNESVGEVSADQQSEDVDMEAQTLLEVPPPTSRMAPPTPPPAGMRTFVINLPDAGDATLTYPADLDVTGYQDLEDYLTLFLKKAKRTPRGSGDDEYGGL